MNTRTLSIAFATLLFVFSLVTPLFAADFFSGEEAVINTPIVADAYALSRLVLIDAPVTGDVFAAGLDVTVVKDVHEDVALVGNKVEVVGDVMGDARIVAGNVTISGTISGDLVIFGGQVTVEQKAVIEGDVYIFADKVGIAGLVSGDISIHAASVTLSGKAVGSLNVRVSDELVLLPSASLSGDLNYSAPDELEIPDGAIIKGSVLKKTEALAIDLSVSEAIAGMFSFIGVWAPLQLLSLLLASVLLYLLFPHFGHDVGVRAVERPVVSFLIGLGFLVIGGVLLIVLALTLVGYLSAWALLLVYLLASMVGMLYRPIIVAVLAARIFSKQKDADISLKWVAFGVLIIVLLGLIRYAGITVNLLLWVIAIGSLVELLYYKFLQRS